ncbi:MAG: 5-methyltetrahydropteroyltriglutamate--homocysteine S-methyltransferase, partial [Betaproteobacteria bacterium]|nr:5-methyltetrahydropteroyltriglutamate--homocysteine S-methyltransferase [Betaproteobacteria bacterium]
MNAPFRADHVGSLLRPQALHEARSQFKKNLISKEKLKAAEDEHIRKVVKLQEDVGLQSITDGEFRRDWWHIDFLHGFDGVDLTQPQYAKGAEFKNTEEQPPFMVISGKLKRTKPSMLDHFKFLKSVVTKGVPKFTMPSPAMLHARADRASLKKVYPDVEEFWADLTRCYREEIADLYKAGCRYLQIDDMTIAMMGDPKVQEQFTKPGDAPRKDSERYAQAINEPTRA